MTEASSIIRRGQPQSPAMLPVGAATGSAWVTAFIIALIIPIQIYLGDVRLSFYRVVLLFAVVPVLIRMVSGSIRLYTADFLILAFALTGAVSLLVTRASIVTVGIFLVESLCPYFLARAFIRNSLQFSAMVRVLTTCIIVTIPFAVYENLTRDPILLTLLGKVFPVLPNVPHEQRLGLDRAQVTFDHPILYGVFCAFGVALAIYASRPGPPVRLSSLRGGLVGLAAFLSLSSGAIVPIVLQGVLFLYDRILRGFRHRWTALAATLVTMYVFAEAFSNRSVPQIAIPYLALNSGNAFTRLAVNDWAISGILERPWFGFGFYLTWPKPWWLVTTSIDNFWLALAFRHGFPTLFLLLVAIAALLLAVIFTRQTDPFVKACRTGYVITIAATCLAIVTVHLWNSTYCAFIFLLGCGMWMTEKQEEPPDAKPDNEPQSQHQQVSRFTRFGGNHPPVRHR